MEQINYVNIKLKRTYIGGSKKKENEIFNNVQSNNNFNWLEYQKILLKYLDDIIHVTYSYSVILEKLSYSLIGVAIILLSCTYTKLSLSVLILSTLLYCSFLILKSKLKEYYISYQISTTIINIEIKNSFNLK